MNRTFPAECCPMTNLLKVYLQKFLFLTIHTYLSRALVQIEGPVFSKLECHLWPTLQKWKKGMVSKGHSLNHGRENLGLDFPWFLSNKGSMWESYGSHLSLINEGFTITGVVDSFISEAVVFILHRKSKHT